MRGVPSGAEPQRREASLVVVALVALVAVVVVVVVVAFVVVALVGGLAFVAFVAFAFVVLVAVVGLGLVVGLVVVGGLVGGLGGGRPPFSRRSRTRVGMSTIDSSGNIHRSAGAPGAGEFAGKVNTAPQSTLTNTQADIFAEVAKPLTGEETLDMLSAADRYRPANDPHVVASRLADLVPPTPSLRIDRDRPTFTDEKEFAYALSRIDELWDPDDSIDSRSEKIIADMRRSGALGEGAGSAREAYARALVLNEAGYIDEDQVNHLLDHMDEGGADYKSQARAFGYHPEQFLSDVQNAADAAGYRSDHASSADAQRAASQRAGTLDAEARRFASTANRGWTSLEEDTERYRDAVRLLDEKLKGDLSGGATEPEIAAEISHNNRIDITAERDAYAFMVDKIEGRWSASA